MSAEAARGPLAGEGAPAAAAELPATGGPAARAAPQPRVAIFVVAEDAVHSLASVLDRIPPAVRERTAEIFVFDAGSRDDTYLVGVGYKAVSGQHNLTIVRGERGGRGAHYKRAIRDSAAKGYDVLVILHADGKYAPEVIESLLSPVERGEVDAVIGSRLLDRRAARAGMPLHKYAAIRTLTWLHNRVLGLRISDCHCGYRAYAVRSIAELPYQANTDALHFDTEMLIQMQQRGLRIAEVPVPAYSGGDTDGWRGLVYLGAVLRSLAQYALHRRGLREYPQYAIAEKYPFRAAPNASHQRVLAMVDRGAQTLLDVGCGAGFLAEELGRRGNRVVGVDARRVAGVEARVSEFVQVDLDRDPIPGPAGGFDGVILADVLEHLREPEALLARARELLREGGSLVVSVPNVAHWSVRLPLLVGSFRYTARGILDRSHLRFYTLASIRAELERAGFAIDRIEATTPPLAEILPGRSDGALSRALDRVQSLGNRLWRELFAYQFVLRARKVSAAPGG
jgi:2-polyprenyl-3-methyl-5-hydroxy-6-metoxy-1,4-benzoquinol methylase